MPTPDPTQLIDALTAEGWTLLGDRDSAYARLCWPGQTDGLLRTMAIPTAGDTTAIGHVLAELARAADTGRRASRVLASLGGQQDLPTNHARTSHGHVCCAWAIGSKPPRNIARCGGPGLCTKCSSEAAMVHARFPMADTTVDQVKSSTDEENRDVENERDLLGRQQQAVLDLCQEQEAYGFTTVTIDRLNQIFITDPADDPEQGPAGDPGPTHRAQSSSAGHAEHVAQEVIHGCAECITAAVTEAAETASRAALMPLADTMADLIFAKHVLRTALQLGTFPDVVRKHIASVLDALAAKPNPAGLDLSPAVERITAIAPGVDLCGDTWLPADVLRRSAAEMAAAVLPSAAKVAEEFTPRVNAAIAGWRHAGGPEPPAELPHPYTRGPAVNTCAICGVAQWNHDEPVAEAEIPGNPYPEGDPRGWTKFADCWTDMCAVQRQHTPQCPQGQPVQPSQ